MARTDKQVAKAIERADFEPDVLREARQTVGYLDKLEPYRYRNGNHNLIAALDGGISPTTLVMVGYAQEDVDKAVAVVRDLRQKFGDRAVIETGITAKPQPADDSPREARKLKEAEQEQSVTAIPAPGSARANMSFRTAALERKERAGTLTPEEERELAGLKGKTDRQSAAAALVGLGIVVAPAVLSAGASRQVLSHLALGQAGGATTTSLIRLSQTQLIILASAFGTIAALNVEGNRERLDACKRSAIMGLR